MQTNKKKHKLILSFIKLVINRENASQAIHILSSKGIHNLLGYDVEDEYFHAGYSFSLWHQEFSFLPFSSLRYVLCNSWLRYSNKNIKRVSEKNMVIFSYKKRKGETRNGERSRFSNRFHLARACKYYRS